MHLPSKVKRFFWDINTSNSNPSLHKKYYIQRILEKGDKSAVTWMLKIFGRKTVKQSVSGIRLSPRSANYWGKVFK